ncbi:MAG: hypothetical protein LBB88_11350 [Planctomycetaceae bacterium]|jgi:DNA repair exonuclease SbcCD nuclease subunit|nr:hypothetical protein [Planctomycetaceae bacterium]
MSHNSNTIPIRQRLPLRFIHASGLFLDRVIEYIPEMTGSWESRFLDISRRATTQLFNKALDEMVDFIIISGDVLNATISPPGLFVFLAEQFEKLNKAGIQVYWTGAEFDSPDDMPISFPLPDNVHHFPTNSIQEYYFKRADNYPNSVLAKIIGISRNQRQRKIRSSEFPIDPARIFTIAIANGDIDPESLSQRRIDYWALGGQNDRTTYQGNPRKKNSDGKPIPLDPITTTDNTKREKKDPTPPPFIVHYPGSTVALNPKMIGQYGATIVEVISGEEPQLNFFQTSPIRWINEQITINENINGIEQLKEELQSRIKIYQNTQKNEDLMINWFINTTHPSQLSTTLRKESVVKDILDELRKEFGQYEKNEPIAWSVDIAVIPPDSMPKQLYEQQTILGDFLREIKHQQDELDQIIDLRKFIPTKLKENNQDEKLNNYDKILLANQIIDPNTNEIKLTQTNEQIELKQEILKKAATIATELLNNENPTQFTINLNNDEKEIL